MKAFLAQKEVEARQEVATRKQIKKYQLTVKVPANITSKVNPVI